MSALNIRIADDELDEVRVNEIGLRERSMLLAQRIDADLAEVPVERRDLHALQRLARLLLNLAPDTRIVSEGDGPTITTSEGLRFGLTPNHTELLLLAYPCPRPRHAGNQLLAHEPIRDVLDLGRVLNRHERMCAKLDRIEARLAR